MEKERELYRIATIGLRASAIGMTFGLIVDCLAGEVLGVILLDIVWFNHNNFCFSFT